MRSTTDTAPDLARQLQSLRRLALAVARPGGPALHDELVNELAQALEVAVVFVAVFADETRLTLRTLAARLDGHALQSFEYPIEGSPCAQVVGRDFRYVAQGVAAEFRPGTMFAAKGMDAYAAYPLADSEGSPLGLLVAMDRRPIAGGDAAHAEAMLKIVAGRLAGEIERGHTDEVLRSVALAVSGARDGTVFDELVRLLATLLRVEVAFVARHDPAEPDRLRILAMHYDGQILRDIPYAIAGTPCATVLGQCFRAYPRDLQTLFPDDHDARAQSTQSYAGIPLTALDGRPLGIVSVASRRPMGQVDRVEAMLKIFALRAAAELERLDAQEALARSEASYRAIFETAEDSIFVHDWETGRILDVNAKAVETYGWTREEFGRLGVADISAGMPPYTAEDALRWIQLAKLGRCPPFEWRRRNRDGSLHWDEVRLKPAMIDGRPHVVAFTRDITERKDALAALQAQEQKYRAIFDGSVDPMVLWDRGLRTVDVNAAFVQTTGLARAEVIGRHWRERPDADDLVRLLPLIEAALSGREAQAVEEVSRADGGRFHIELRYLPVRLGDTDYALGIGRDVTLPLERERALRNSEEQYRAIFNASADALVLRDAAFRIVDVNATYERMSGYALDAAVGVDRVLANPPHMHDEIRALHERALAGEAVQIDTQLVRRDGRTYDLELRGVPTRHRGEPHVLYIGRDITERKRAEQALRASEEQYRAIFNAATDALILWNSRYQRVDVNDAYERIYGWSRDEVIGRGFDLQRYAPEDVRPRHELVRRALAGESCSAELDAVCKSGAHILTEVQAIPFLHRGEPHVLAIARDITERRAAEMQRAELERQLRQAQKMEAIGQLTGGIAHDFNNILTSVIGWQALASERAEALGDAGLQRQLAQAALAADRARALVAQMLAFARRQRGARRALALAPLVQRTLGLLRATLPATLALQTQGLEDDGPTVLADPVQLEQVLFNLCINARDAMPGGGTLEVRLDTAPAGPAWHCASCRERVAAGAWVRLVVRDEGAGIAPELLERIFDPFFSTKAPGSGSGMGLAMVHGIVHDHGGHLGLQTAPGAGARFEVWLPRADAAADAPGSAGTAAAAAPALAGRVLLVEDDAMVGEFLVERLRSWGLEPRWMRDPLAALDWLRDPAQACALLITDQTMPGLTGLQLAERAGALRPTLPRLLISGNAAAFEPAALARAGVAAALAKPLDEARLRALLQRWLAAG